MEPPSKKTKLTDHFRVALRPRDLNVLQSNQNKANNKGRTSPGGKKQGASETTAKALVTTNTTNNTLSILNNNYHNINNNNASTSSSAAAVEIVNLVPPPQTTRKSFLNTTSISSLISNLTGAGATAGPGAGAGTVSGQTTTTTTNTNTLTTKPRPTQNTLISNYKGPPNKADSIPDYDKSLLNNVCWEPHYAWDSFEYDRQQELKFRIRKYINTQTGRENEVTSTTPMDLITRELSIQTASTTTTTPTSTFEQNQYITPQRRAELVDWLVEVQMRFALDHEPLYMAVKLADHYLMHKYIESEDFILLYLTAMLISVKYDERVPPLTIPHLIAVTKAKFGVKYTRRQIISLEVDLLATLDFNIRFPLSYGFLRRFARCTRSNPRTINLARYILECSLMDYNMIDLLDSEIAAGSLLLAFEMLHLSGAWDETATYYTGYKEQELFPLVIRLNRMLLRLSKKRTAIKRKYSHETFLEVARIPMLPTPLLTSSIF